MVFPGPFFCLVICVAYTLDFKILQCLLEKHVGAIYILHPNKTKYWFPEIPLTHWEVPDRVATHLEYAVSTSGTRVWPGSGDATRDRNSVTNGVTGTTAVLTPES